MKQAKMKTHTITRNHVYQNIRFRTLLLKPVTLYLATLSLVLFCPILCVFQVEATLLCSADDLDVEKLLILAKNSGDSQRNGTGTGLVELPCYIDSTGVHSH